jgi:flagellar protein FliJ
MFLPFGVRAWNRAGGLLRRRASEKETRVALLGTMIRDFEGMIAQLEVAAEEDCTRIKDPSHPAYSMFAKAAAKRHQNLLVSGEHTRSLLDVAKRELGEVAAQLLDVEPINSNQPSLTPQSIPAA